MTRQKIIRTGVFVVQAVICVVKLAPRHEWTAYFFMIGLALVVALVNVKVNVHLVIHLAVTLVVELLGLGLFFHLTGAKFSWLFMITFTMFWTLVAPATVIFYKSLK